jgi:uncharacterized iron-regulated protein
MIWLAIAACGPKAPPAPSPPTPAVAPGPEPAAPAPSGQPWATELRADHDLVGRIWSGTGFVDPEAMLTDLREADFVLLGERHDHPDHHRLQGRLISELRPPAVGFEMLDHEDDLSGDTAEALATSVGWAESGWPEFALYEPVFTATLDADATVIAAHPTKAEVRTAMKEGVEALGDAAAGLPVKPLTDAQRGELEQEIVDSHCGHASEPVVAMMVAGQVLKDAWMARELTAAGPRSVLVAGNGHTRTDRGVPWYLEGVVKSVAFVEVGEQTDPAAYAEHADYVWFTPRVDEVDPCEAYREQLEKMSAPKPAP